MAGGVARGLAPMMAAACLALAAGCASGPAEDPEEAEAFRQDIQESAETVDAMLEQTRSGRNVSEFGLGMFAMTVLNELSTRDAELSRRIHADGRSTDLYLREVFQAHPAEEIAAIHSMSDKGQRTLRLSAQHMLEALRHIPDRDDSRRTQERQRRELASELAVLKSLLDKAAAEVVVPPVR